MSEQQSGKAGQELTDLLEQRSRAAESAIRARATVKEAKLELKRANAGVIEVESRMAENGFSIDRAALMLDW
jgi:hypothetical protein